MADAALLERPTKTRKIEDVVKELRDEANNGNGRRKAVEAAATATAIVTPPSSLVAPRYRILPGTVIKSGNNDGKKPTNKVPPPPPPAEAPPTVTHIMNLALLGPPSSGKTSLVDSVVSRAYNTTVYHKSKSKKRKKIDQDQEVYTHSEKDFAFSNDRCVNVRFLDVHGFEVSKRDKRSELTLEPTEHWNKPYGRIHGVLLVISISNLYPENDDDGDSAAEERLFSTVREWKTLIDHTNSLGDRESAVTLVLTNADKLNSGLVGKPHPVDWARLCSRLSKLCREIGISNWYTTSSVFGSTSSDTQMAPGESFDAILRSISDHAEPANTTTTS